MNGYDKLILFYFVNLKQNKNKQPILAKAYFSFHHSNNDKP